MLGSDYRELIVPKQYGQGKTLGLVILCGAVAVITLIGALFTGAFALLLLTLIAGFGAWYFWYTGQIEYEYVISGDEMRITKIIAQSRRKEMLVFPLGNVTAFGRYTEAGADSAGQTLVLACTAPDSSAYYADLDHAQHGQTRLVLTPNDDILLYFEKHLPRRLNFRAELTGSADE